MNLINNKSEIVETDLEFNIPKGEYTVIGNKKEVLGELFVLEKETYDFLKNAHIRLEKKWCYN